LTTPQSNGANGIPRIGATLARVQMTAGLVRQLAFEVFERAGFVTIGIPNQPAQPMERYATEPYHAARLVGLRRDTSRQFAFGFAERLSCDMDRRSKPVGKRKFGQQGEGPPGLAKPFFPPARVRQPDPMAPVVGLEGHSAAQRCQGGRMVAGAIEN